MASSSSTALQNGSPPQSAPDALSQRIQIIDDTKTFTNDLNAQIERWGLRDAGFSYNVVAVFGSQSTGKSTLLNGLFGTTFDVMDESKRQQTTKGIWMCRGTEMNVMVMDVEGTDGRERGEDQDFERKSALFSLASSEVLIVNLWEHQVGLYQGANMGLLKTVFEVNLGLFGKKGPDGTNSRTLLLFVIRDHIGTTPLANLEATLTQDIMRIWDSLAKPTELKDSQLSDYFDLAFTALPHKYLVPEKFQEALAALRNRFVSKDDPNFVFKPAYHKRIPADGVAFYMEGIWEQVQTNKDLDLPTQQELLAQFRCDEISGVALSEFNEQAKSQKRPIESGRVVEDLGKMMKSWRTEALARYDRDASRYHQGVYKRKRADLLAALDSTLSPLFLGQLKNLHKSCLVTFKKDMLQGMTGEGYNFADVVEQAREKCEGDFAAGAKEAVVEEDSDLWGWEEELELLKEEIRSVANQCRKDETKKMVNLIEKTFKKQISEPVELHLNKPAPNMWDNILKVFKDTLEKAEKQYLAKAKSFDCTEEENDVALADIRQRAWMALRQKVDEQTTDAVILSKLRAHFEERFRYDEHGVPRVWKPEDDIDSVFKKAKEQTLEIVPLYSKISPADSANSWMLPPSAPSLNSSEDDFDFEASLIIFTETKVIDLTNKFRRDADAYYVEAKRSTVSSIAQIPAWMFGVLVVLGWNEAMLVLFNPLYFTMLLVGLVSAYLIMQLGLAGPLYQVIRTVAAEVQRQATAKLREQFAQPALEAPVRSTSAAANTTTRTSSRTANGVAAAGNGAARGLRDTTGLGRGGFEPEELRRRNMESM
ncbi:Dynamin-like GTPase that mediates homotypic ER fusion [Pleurotus ostreatus]|uniref:Dynamin-like GTPase that mediates homotypic ER fusion n=1 Tax=Pleurotus ostreatus TaxID=5322 RepID=A0A8H6ZQM3_PLEOS|nr:Dynamin-like GTPase that mediates homotypic ER fusion [Pleurotus ostreatus]KAF7427975.1 Dynamin-like GTPase that mediates homotypic ER fusion [Pleurotus ostreatus]KAJ8696006.1 Dynamin-like GTPase that mediates homotypic ER fusion [Pleurotus ostreatus]